MLHKPNLTLYLGGTRSGKSALAEARVQTQASGAVLYVATTESQSDDPSMQERIQQHRARRPESWHTLECPLQLAKHISIALEDYGISCSRLCKNIHHSGKPIDKSASRLTTDIPTILLDCVTIWVSNILFSLPDPEDLKTLEKNVRHEVGSLLALIQSTPCRWVIVSGETGLGGIAATHVERNYHDALGLANQLIASYAHEVFLVVAGRLLRLEDVPYKILES